MAYIPRLFCSLPTPIALPYAYTHTDPDDCHHLSVVLRLKPGDPVDVVSDGQCYHAQWQAGSPRGINLLLTDVQPLPETTLPFIALAVGLIPDERWRWMVQKCTELGVNQITPLVTAHSKVPLAQVAHKQPRWQAIARAAASQSEGLFIPQVQPAQIPADWCRQLPVLPADGLKPECRLHLLERSDSRQPMRDVLRQTPVVRCVVGPEKGWDDAECDLFARYGFVAVSLGSRILRTETAAMAAVSSIILALG
jgi:16S rRNA (uracil1498-N3)-methyltransferase